LKAGQIEHYLHRVILRGQISEQNWKAANHILEYIADAINFGYSLLTELGLKQISNLVFD